MDKTKCCRYEGDPAILVHATSDPYGNSLLRLVAPEHGNCTVRIVDAQGRLMTAESTFELINGINELSLPTEGLADGLYSVQVVYTSLANKGLHGAFIQTLPLTIRK